MSDVLHDGSYRHWLELAEKHEALIPSFVLSYTFDKEGASQMEDGLFADPARRLYPIDSPAATWLSAAYFMKQASKLPYKKDEKAYVWARIEKAAEIHGVKDDMQKIASAIQAEGGTEKQAESDDDNYGWVMRDAATNTVVARKYPMFDGRGVKMASSYFDENRSNYPLAVRRDIARNIMKRADAHGVGIDELHPSVLREAGYGIPRKDVLMEEILERAYLTKDAECAILLANINEMVASMPEEDVGANLDKIAEVIEAYDRTSDLTQYYGTRILMPADFLFDINLKTAEEALADSVELDRHVFSLTKLAELPLTVYQEILGEEFGKAIVKTGGTAIDKEKLADNLFSLPKPDKAALEEHLAEIFG